MSAEVHQRRDELAKHDHQLQSRADQAPHDLGRTFRLVDGNDDNAEAGHCEVNDAANSELGYCCGRRLKGDAPALMLICT